MRNVRRAGIGQRHAALGPLNRRLPVEAGKAGVDPLAAELPRRGEVEVFRHRLRWAIREPIGIGVGMDPRRGELQHDRLAVAREPAAVVRMPAEAGRHRRLPPVLEPHRLLDLVATERDPNGRVNRPRPVEVWHFGRIEREDEARRRLLHDLPGPGADIAVNGVVLGARELMLAPFEHEATVTDPVGIGEHEPARSPRPRIRHEFEPLLSPLHGHPKQASATGRADDDAEALGAELDRRDLLGSPPWGDGAHRPQNDHGRKGMPEDSRGGGQRHSSVSLSISSCRSAIPLSVTIKRHGDFCPMSLPFTRPPPGASSGMLICTE